MPDTPTPGTKMVPLSAAFGYANECGNGTEAIERLEAAAVPWPALPDATSDDDQISVPLDVVDVVVVLRGYRGRREITVERRGIDGDDSWAVCWMGSCCDERGRWDHEPQPSSRTDAYKRRTRFTFARAMEVAEKAKPSVIAALPPYAREATHE